VSWLGEVLGLTSSGVTRLVDRLVERGWVSRSPGSDARQRRVRLTATGTKRAQVLLRERDDVLAEAVDSLGDTDRTQLETLLSRVVGSLARDYVPALRTCRLCDRDTCNSGGEGCPLGHTVPADV
jgi:DNA-binding MarR family transcriptional regulator